MTQPGRRRILYVEDDPDLRELGQLALEMERKFDVDACASGAEAIARAGDCLPDLILLDVRMPGMDGPQTLRRLRELEGLAATPAVFMTGGTTNAEVEALYAAGAVAVVGKPFEIDRLSSQIDEIWMTFHANDH